ncbi:MAG: molybdenum cofactor biosynthesis protein B [Gammaproteobacteria bacterium]|nr:molybdenum cofactor biosynthesis protein B [Gammaproteobacteria bacterium]MYF01713.1 molybdenum cofactor biosynthesis protein B [Gammaproteobacteria bacterium]MYI77331.1 molybdenum cofactor biosynthesis protein B [Gammaproteobacteria bacterium]
MNIAVLTISDTRTSANDTSGDYLVTAMQESHHVVPVRKIVRDDIYAIRAIISEWISNDQIEVIVTTGGTGFGGRDSTPEALTPLFDKQIDGFGELFRFLSFSDIGTSTIQSRALAGFANGTFIFALPGSTGACRLAWEQILVEQLDESFRPCNFAELVSKSKPTTE